MHCPECKVTFPDNLHLCPQCGTSLEDTRPMRVRRSNPKPASDAAAQVTESAGPLSRFGRNRVRRIALWGSALIVVLALVLGGAVYGGLYQGERDRQQRKAVLAEQHYRAGLERLEAGEHELAMAEFEYVLQVDPSHQFAPQGIAEAKARISARPTPTEEVVQVELEMAGEELYQTATEKHAADQWKEAIATLTQLRILEPDYRAEAVEEMLYDSLYKVGMAALDEGQLEEGIFYLDQAVALRPLDDLAVTQRSWAVHYMTALGYWGVDWELCIERLEYLNAISPGYRDVFQRLYQARVRYADAWSDQGEMCPAEGQYELALQLINAADTERKLAAARADCLIATPTPIPPLEGTDPITLTEPPPGFTVGRLAYPIYNTQVGTYDVYALFADGYLMKMAAGADQPSWIWSTGALVFRDRFSPGIALLPPGQGTSLEVIAGDWLASPTFSPDGRRMAYASNDMGGWQIHLAPSGDPGAGQLHATGTGPAWGPTGLLAWTGCTDESGCGIYADNPDDDQPAHRLTASDTDIAVGWAPDGGSMVYMSNVSGNWDVYVVGVRGGVSVLTDDPSSDGLPAWAPDGSGIAFVSNRGGAWGIYLMGPNGEDPHKILNLGPNLPDWTDQRLSWAP